MLAPAEASPWKQTTRKEHSLSFALILNQITLQKKKQFGPNGGPFRNVWVAAVAHEEEEEEEEWDAVETDQIKHPG